MKRYVVDLKKPDLKKPAQAGKSSKVLDNGVKVELPTQETVRLWVRRDISASSYFLGMLMRYPDLVDQLADELYKRILADEKGALIDRIHAKAETHAG